LIGEAPGFSGTRFGLLSRIATAPCPCVPAYGLVRNGVFIDAVPIHYDTDEFLSRFVARWPAGSAAHGSYFRRIVDGPEHTIAAARSSL